MYHYVRNIKGSRLPGIKGLEFADFKKQISFLRGHNFCFVTLKDVLEKRNLAGNSVLLTFDDGYLDHYLNVFPFLYENGIYGVFSMPAKIIREKKILDVNKIHYILASVNVKTIKKRLFDLLDIYRSEYGVYENNEELYHRLAQAWRYDDKDTVFIKLALQTELPEKLRNIIVDDLFHEFVSDNESIFVDELYMNMEQIRLMKNCGMEFGLHGYEHYYMNSLTNVELRDDVTKAIEVFDGVIDASNWSFVYPYGSYSDDVIALAKSMGATSGLGTDVAIYRPDVDDVFKIPRLDCNDFPPKSENYIRIAKKFDTIV